LSDEGLMCGVSIDVMGASRSAGATAIGTRK
jgi:hypothetical protein